MRCDLDQDDWFAWKTFTEKVGGSCQVAGDGLTVTNVIMLSEPLMTNIAMHF